MDCRRVSVARVAIKLPERRAILRGGMNIENRAQKGSAPDSKHGEEHQLSEDL